MCKKFASVKACWDSWCEKFEVKNSIKIIEFSSDSGELFSEGNSLKYEKKGTRSQSWGISTLKYPSLECDLISIKLYKLLNTQPFLNIYQSAIGEASDECKLLGGEDDDDLRTCNSQLLSARKTKGQVIHLPKIYVYLHYVRLSRNCAKLKPFHLCPPANDRDVQFTKHSANCRTRKR